jgi:S-formylglutathione hydrolase FrmB
MGRTWNGLRGLLVVGILAAATSSVCGLDRKPARFVQLNQLECRLQGSLLDFTHHHGADRRIYSPALDARRDMYVYLPPGYDPSRAYPAMIVLHGIAQNEQFFLRVVEDFDRAMACGQLPPFIIAAPDGSLRPGPALFSGASFYLNTDAGRFEDYIVCDIWQFLLSNFQVRPEREFHMLCGGSAGGFGTYNLGFKHRDQFKILIGFLPALNLRYQDCHGRYFAAFDPNCTGLRERIRPWQPIAKYYGLITIREKQLSWPLFGKQKTAIRRISEENPVEMLDRCDIRPGEFDMFIGYGGRDEFNIDAQVESFLHVARHRGLAVEVVYDPNGHHVPSTALRMFPAFANWLGPVLRGYEQSLPSDEPLTLPPVAPPIAGK